MLPTVGSNHSCNATSNSSTRTALGVSTLFVFIRCCYRVAELQAGFGGAVANNEAVFEVLEGPMIMVAVIALSVFHPASVSEACGLILGCLREIETGLLQSTHSHVSRGCEPLLVDLREGQTQHLICLGSQKLRRIRPC